MTPTLIGRWQTRIVMILTLGAIVTAIFTAVDNNRTYFIVLGYVLGFGLIWDILYIFLQTFRWERDWPAAFTILNGIVEGALIYALIATTGLPGIKSGSVDLGIFVAQYGAVWLSIFIWIEGPMRVVAPFWRFSGGRLV